ncbi:hypothetical protein [Sphingomonas hengshuiensis]|nr:hypothetical protein [Sphingomonas hengshuiensis]
MRWLPRFESYEWCGCDDGGEFEGREFTATWGRWTMTLAFGRYNGRLD